MNASLVPGFIDGSGIAVSGSDLFVDDDNLTGLADYGNIGEYTTSGGAVNPFLITGLDTPVGIAVFGSDLFVATWNFGGNTGAIGEYTTSGAVVNASLVSGLYEPYAITVSGSDLFVTTENGTIGEYTTSGAVVNASLVSGLRGPSSIVVVPPLTWNNAGGTGDGQTWDSGANQNWNNGTGAAVFHAGAEVIFNDDNAGHYAVILNTTVSPSSVTVNNSAGNYAISGTGSIAGDCALTKMGSSTLTLSTVNTYTGGTTISGGTLQTGSAGALGTGTVAVASPGILDLDGNSPTVGNLSGTGTVDNVIAAGNPTLTINTSTSSTFSGVIQNTTGSVAITVSGSGIQTLSGANTYTGGTTIMANSTLQTGSPGALGAGKVAVAGTLDLDGSSPNIGNLSGAGTVDNVSAGGTPTLTITTSASSNFSGIVKNTTGSVAVTVGGTGIQTLSGANTYTGGTTVNAGELSVANTTGSATGSGNVTLNGGILASGPIGSISGNVLAGSGSHTIAPGGVVAIGTLTVGGLTSNSLTTLNFDLGAGTGPEIANGDLLILGPGVNIGARTLLAFNGTSTIGDDYRLIGGSIGGINVANFTLPAAPTGEAYSLSNDGVDPGFIDLVVTTGGGVGAGPANLTWNDFSTNNSWDTGTSANWNNGLATTVYHAQDKVTFDDSSSGHYTVTLNTVESPDSMVVNNSAGNYTISGTGSIAGIGSLTKSGTGTLTLSTQNTYTGGTTVSAGELSVANTAGSATGTGNVTLNGGTLASGTTGSISGNVLAGGGSNTIAPGGVGTVGSLTIGGLTTTNLTTLNFDLGAGTGQITNGDLLTLGSGTVSIGSGTLVTFGGTPTIGDDYRLIAGSISGINAANFTLPTAPTGEAYSLSKNGVEPGYIDLVVLPKGALSISSDTVRLPNNVTAGTALATSNVNLTSLSLTGNGTLDIGNNRIIINYSSPATDPIASIKQWIADGTSGATGPAIISSDIATDDTASGLSYAIGYADGADGLVAGLPSGEIEIMFTLLGDANLDGTVNAEDFTQFSHNLGQAGTTWDDGDFNYDGTVNAEDFTPFSANLGKSATLAAQAGVFESAHGLSLTNVPEPMSGGMIALAGLGMLCRRRRARR